MESLSLHSTALGLLASIVAASSQSNFNQAAAQAVIPETSPNVALTVHTEAGTCPEAIGAWTDFRYYEGGGEHTAIVNTAEIAGPARFMDSKEKFVIYGAPLEAEYASCVGWVVSEELPYYNIWLQFGHVYFRFDLDSIPNRPLSAITYQNIVSGQPYIRWAIAD